jgi:hypothetical protein
MTWRHFLLLGLLGLLTAGVVSAFQPAPGYMDADYYAAGGFQLAAGRGFTEPYLWNYLDEPAGLPHPSNAYWMPLASLLAAAGAMLFGPLSWTAARIGFLLVAGCLPPLCAALGYALTARRDLALASGLLAAFSGFYLQYLPVTDTFGPYMLLGCLFFLTLGNRRWSDGWRGFLLGLLAGLLHLTRADGLLWLLIACLALVIFVSPGRARSPSRTIAGLALCLAGYLIVMGPWMLRNWSVFGTLLAPGGSRSLWLTTYNQLFAYPASGITFTAWWQSGLRAIAEVRLWSLGMNLANALAVQGEVYLLPLIGIGLWVLRKDRRVQIAGAAWLLTLGAMTLVFPFAGARGGFLHSGAAVQSVWWALAPIGLDRVILWGEKKRGWNASQARPLFQKAMVVAAVLLSAFLVWTRVIGGANHAQAWGTENVSYRQIGAFLSSRGISKGAVVVVANPPGFYLATGYSAIAVPDGTAETVQAVGRMYGARYLVLEKDSMPKGMQVIYDRPASFAGLTLLGELEDAHVYLIQP